MYGFELNASIPIKEVISSLVISAFENDNIDYLAKQTVNYDVGRIVVTNNKGNPVDVMTEKDIVIRVTSKNRFPSSVKAKEAT